MRSVGRDDARLGQRRTHGEMQAGRLEIEGDLRLALELQDALQQRRAEALPRRCLRERAAPFGPVEMEHACRRRLLDTPADPDTALRPSAAWLLYSFAPEKQHSG